MRLEMGETLLEVLGATDETGAGTDEGRERRPRRAWKPRLPPRSRIKKQLGSERMADKAADEAEGPRADARQKFTKRGRYESRQRGHRDWGIKSHKRKEERNGRDGEEEGGEMGGKKLGRNLRAARFGVIRKTLLMK